MSMERDEAATTAAAKDLNQLTYVLTHLVCNVLVEALLFLSSDFMLGCGHVFILLDPFEVLGNHVLI